LPLSCRRGLWKKAPVFFCFLFAAGSLYPRGKAEGLPPPINTEYVFCITSFDVSDLPPAQAGLGPILQSRFASKLGGIDRRARSSEELALYGERAYTQARDGVIVQLAAKRKERDDLLFTGLPRWKYSRELRRVNKELKELEKVFAKTENETIRVEERPLFVLTEGSFPPPLPGSEDEFLDAQKADAFLSGKLSPYYGRIYAELRIYTRDSAFVFEDAVIFSYEDTNDAADELAVRIEEAAAGTARAALTVTADPEDARILVNGKLAASGESVLLNPGEVSVAVSAEGYENFSGILELIPGEEAGAGVALNPVESEILKLSAPGAKIYIGALYVGTVPPGGDLEISVPRDRYRYISAETEDGRRGEVIVLGEQQSEEGRYIEINPRIIPGQDEKPVEKRRRQFYGAWGRLWVTLPLAFFLDGVARSYANAYNSSGSEEILERFNTRYYISRGAMIAAGVFGAESLIRLIIYISTANRESVPLRK
jgi:hypothetical protein